MYTPKTIDEEAEELAQRFVEEIKSSAGIDFTPHLAKIQEDIADYVFNGNWDHTIDVEDDNFPNIRVIEENEYDQSMDDDEKPSWDDVIDLGGHYIWLE